MRMCPLIYVKFILKISSVLAGESFIYTHLIDDYGIIAIDDHYNQDIINSITFCSFLLTTAVVSMKIF